MIPTIQFLREIGRRELGGTSNRDTEHLEVDLLLGQVLGVERVQIVARSSAAVSAADQEEFGRLLARRRLGEPIAYILGRREFFGRDFIITPAVLIPRPETEIVVERALQQFEPECREFSLIDIGTGSGAIILSIMAELRERYGQSYLSRGRAAAVDISRQALDIAEANAAALGLVGFVDFIQSDLLENPAARAVLAPAAMRQVVSNPPYVPALELLPKDVADYEPALALRAGADGLEVIRRIISALSTELSDDLRFLVECGEGQAAEIAGLLSAAGAARVEQFADYAGIARVVGANLK